MCAIIGVASANAIKSKEWLIRGRNSMVHRGPDDCGDWHSRDLRVRLAHSRLSIIDKSSAGHQPMTNLAGDITVVFNGEIYNFLELKKQLSKFGHKFVTSSDTEVLIASWIEWGTECVKHLNGMFAFAIHDGKKNTLFLARDRAGEKPLYYSYIKGEIRFSSELKGLLADANFSKSLNIKAFNLYLERGYVPGELSILNNMNKLPAATALLFKYHTNEIKKWQYWSIPKIESEFLLDDPSKNRLIVEFEGLFENSVRRQLNADVPVGVLLSGGLDSSLITAMASRCKDKVNTFTVNFTGHDKYNESAHAELISNYFKTNHINIECKEISPEVLLKLARQFDEPICDSSILPTYFLSQKVKNYCTVALGGDGGDELFGGYSYYNRLIYLDKISKYVHKDFRKVLKKVSSFLPTGFKGKYLLNSIGMNFNNELPLISSYFETQDRKNLLANNKLFNDNYWPEELNQSDNIIQSATRSDFNNFLREDVLVKIDRSSMLNSLEIRAPFLDKEIIDFSFGKIPSSLKVSKNDRKILLKQFAKTILPESFDFNRKQGFSVPLEHWMKGGPWRDILHDVLLSQKCFFEKKFISHMINSLDLGRDNSERLFCLLFFELWRIEHGVS